MIYDLNSFEYGEHRLAYEVHGAGPQTVVLLHGLLLDAHVNRDLGCALADAGFRVVLLDLLGHGRSDRPHDPTLHRFDLYAKQVVALLDHLEVRQAVIGGLSLGADVSLHVAALAPNRVRALFIEMPEKEWATPSAAILFAPLLITVRRGRPVVRLWAKFWRALPRPRNHTGISVMNPMDLYHMPYTHSLLGSAVFGALFAALIWIASRNRTAALIGFASSFVSASIGGLVARQFDGTVTPIFIGHAVVGTLALITIFITERGKLMKSHNSPGHTPPPESGHP